MARVSRALHVTWRGQADTTGLYYPVGRLCEVVESEQAAPIYEFVYIEGVNAALHNGFRPFVEFPSLERVYRSRELFPIFANRLMNRSRPDYEEYVRRLGLVLPNVNPLDILGRSMGARATDTIEMFPFPVRPASTDCYTTFFLLRGIRHRKPEEQQRIERLNSGEPLTAKQENENVHDPNAVLVLTVDDIFIGYIPSYLAEDAQHLLRECGQLEVRVERVNPSPAPVQHRVLCRLEACWPDGFIPFSTPRYKPMPAHAQSVNPLELAAV